MHSEDPAQTHVGFVIASYSVLCSLGILEPSGTYNHSSLSSEEEFPELCLMFGSRSLYLFVSVAGESLRDDDTARHRSMNIAEFH